MVSSVLISRGAASPTLLGCAGFKHRVTPVHSLSSVTLPESCEPPAALAAKWLVSNRSTSQLPAEKNGKKEEPSSSGGSLLSSSDQVGCSRRLHPGKSSLSTASRCSQPRNVASTRPELFQPQGCRSVSCRIALGIAEALPDLRDNRALPISKCGARGSIWPSTYPLLDT